MHVSFSSDCGPGRHGKKSGSRPQYTEIEASIPPARIEGDRYWDMRAMSA
jgi:hypothetical protein